MENAIHFHLYCFSTTSVCFYWMLWEQFCLCISCACYTSDHDCPAWPSSSLMDFFHTLMQNWASSNKQAVHSFCYYMALYCLFYVLISLTPYSTSCSLLDLVFNDSMSATFSACMAIFVHIFFASATVDLWALSDHEMVAELIYACHVRLIRVV